MKIPTVIHNGFSFVTVNKPTTQDIRFLNETFGFSLLNLEDYLYKTQIPKIETYSDYTLVVMDTPYIQQQAKTKKEQRISFPIHSKVTRRKRITVGEVDFFIGKDYLVVLHDDRTPQIDELFEMCKLSDKNRSDFMGKGPAYLFYRIADTLVDASMSYVDDITNTIDFIDRQLEDSRSSSVIEDISMTRRNIVVFETMIKPTLPIFADLEKGKYAKLSNNMTQYWSNILDHLQKIWDRLEDNKELIEGISRSHESLVSTRTNEIIKVLTIFTAILLPLTLLASVYGMNVQLPFEHSAGAFFILMVIMFGLAVLMIFFFKLREWL